MSMKWKQALYTIATRFCGLVLINVLVIMLQAKVLWGSPHFFPEEALSWLPINAFLNAVLAGILVYRSQWRSQWASHKMVECPRCGNAQAETSREKLLRERRCSACKKISARVKWKRHRPDYD